MPIFSVTRFSAAMQRQVQVLVLLPEGPGPFPVVYQLGGLSDDHTMWQRNTTIECLANTLGLAVVLPDGGRSWYSNHLTNRFERGEDLLVETITWTDATFRTIPKRSHRGISGLSMGGYGTCKMALKHPALFVSAVSHSGAVDVEGERTSDWVKPEIEAIWNGRKVPPQDDLFALAKAAAKQQKELPALHLDCGTEDFLLPDNRRFTTLLRRLKIAHEYREYPGDHNWQYWQDQVASGLQFHATHFAKAILPKPRRPSPAKRKSHPT